MKGLLLLVVLNFAVVCSVIAQPAPPLYETRAVWFATVLGDGGWPNPNTGPGTQIDALQERIRQARTNGINTFIFQAVGRGDALYPSARLPWSPQPKGAGEDPGYDPLAEAIAAAHTRGMELHAWINVFRVGDSNTLALFDGVSNPAHVAYAHPEWVEEAGGSLWIIPSHEETRAWLVGNVLEIVTTYDVDAVHFDFIRYPPGGLPNDGDRFQADPRNSEYASIGDWRREQITAFVRDAHAAIMAVKPWVKVGSTPIGNYRNNGWPALFGYSDVFQASREWLAEGIHDYLAPQIYWDIANDPPFDALAQEWVDESAGRPIFTGIGAYVDSVQAEVDAQIDVARAAGASGQVFFRFEHMLQVSDLMATRYTAPALPAPVAHRFEAAAPALPDALDITADGDAAVTLTWLTAAGTAADPLRAYVLFRRVGEAPDPARAEDLLTVLNAETFAFTESFAAPPETPVYYRLAAISRLGILSDATAPVSTDQVMVATEPEALRPAIRLDPVYPNPTRNAATASYEIQQASHVSIIIYDALGRAVATPVDGPHPAGRHELHLDATSWPSGLYYCELRLADQRRVQSFLVVH